MDRTGPPNLLFPNTGGAPLGGWGGLGAGNFGQHHPAAPGHRREAPGAAHAPAGLPACAPPNGQPRVSEPYLVVSGVLPSGDWLRVSTAFRQCGQLVFEQQHGGKLWLQYADDKGTGLAMAKSNTPAVEGIFVRVNVAPVLPSAVLSARDASRRERVLPAANGKGLFAAPLGHTGAGLMSTSAADAVSRKRKAHIPASSLGSGSGTVQREERINHIPLKRPHFSLRLFLLRKKPEEPKRLPSGHPVPKPLLRNQLVKYSVPLPAGDPPTKRARIL